MGLINHQASSVFPELEHRDWKVLVENGLPLRGCSTGGRLPASPARPQAHEWNPQEPAEEARGTQAQLSARGLTSVLLHTGMPCRCPVTARSEGES